MSADERSKKPTGSRRVAREAALKALYGVSIGRTPIKEAIDAVLEATPLLPMAETFMRSLVEGTRRHGRELDSHIEPYLASGWELDRLAVTDRIVLRLGAYELLYLSGIPPKVTISEIVNLADSFGPSGSAKFVHGVLAKVLLESPKANWDPSQAERYVEEEPEEEPIPEPVVEETLEEGSPEYEDAVKTIPWVIRSDDETETP